MSAGTLLGGLVLNVKMSYVKQERYRAHDLRSELVEVDDGATVLRCWVPWQQPEGGMFDAELPCKPVLLFLHDFVGDGTITWERQIGAFRRDYHVYVPDLVFFGGSTSTKADRSEAFQADCMVKMLEKKGVNSEVRMDFKDFEILRRV